MSLTDTIDQADRAPSVPGTMRAMVLDEFGGELHLRERRVPEPRHGEVLVRVLAVGAGVTAELARDGVLGGSVPRVHGRELSGTIVGLGPGGSGWSPGRPSHHLVLPGVQPMRLVRVESRDAV